MAKTDQERQPKSRKNRASGAVERGRLDVAGKASELGSSGQHRLGVEVTQEAGQARQCRGPSPRPEGVEEETIGGGTDGTEGQALASPDPHGGHDGRSARNPAMAGDPTLV